MHKMSIVERLNIEVIKEENSENTIVSLYNITKDIVDRPSILSKEDLDDLCAMLNMALKRVFNIDNDCIEHILLKNKLNGNPQSWLDSVFELRILNRPGMQLIA